MMEALFIILFVSLMFNAMFAAYFMHHSSFIKSVERLLGEYEKLVEQSPKGE